MKKIEGTMDTFAVNRQFTNSVNWRRRYSVSCLCVYWFCLCESIEFVWLTVWFLLSMSYQTTGGTRNPQFSYFFSVGATNLPSVVHQGISMFTKKYDFKTILTNFFFCTSTPFSWPNNYIVFVPTTDSCRIFWPTYS